MRRRVTLRIGPPPPDPPPKPKPFTVLAKPRFVPTGLPSDLAAWYAKHEGIGFAASAAIHNVRLAKHAELKPVAAAEVTTVTPETEATWAGFRGLLLAHGNNARIVYTLGGKAHRFGSIVGFGPAIESGRIVLDVTLPGWLERLKRDDWIEWGLDLAGTKDLPRGKVEALRRHLGRVNPGLKI